MEYEEIKELERRKNLVFELMQTHYWKEIIKPQFDNRLAMLDAMITTETDPWKRYGLVDAYKYMKEFRLWFDDTINKGD